MKLLKTSNKMLENYQTKIGETGAGDIAVVEFPLTCSKEMDKWIPGIRLLFGDQKGNGLFAIVPLEISRRTVVREKSGKKFFVEGVVVKTKHSTHVFYEEEVEHFNIFTASEAKILKKALSLSGENREVILEIASKIDAITKEEKFYFTFGSDPEFPYQNTYLVVVANSLSEAVEKFRKKYPDRHGGCVNCAFFYSEKEWKGSINERYYQGDPVDIIT